MASARLSENCRSDPSPAGSFGQTAVCARNWQSGRPADREPAGTSSGCDPVSNRLRQESVPSLPRIARGAAIVLLVTFAICCAVAALLQHPREFGWDSHPYWLTRHGVMYRSGPMAPDAYLYSPAFAELIRPWTYLSWPAFAVSWSVALGLVLAWLLAPLRWWAIPLWVAGLPEIVAGNVFIPLAVVAAVGLQRRAVWAFAALTKVTVCLGPVWFAVRREWRELGVSVGVTCIVALLSWAAEPQAWAEWIRFLESHAGRSTQTLGAVMVPPLAYRLPVAVLLVAWAAHTGRRWALPLGMVLASPVLWLGTLTMLSALPRIHDHYGSRKHGQDQQPIAV